MKTNYIVGHIVDVIDKKIFDGKIIIENGKITGVIPCSVEKDSPFIMPGFIDSHIHIESSMLKPSSFASIAVKHGTIGAVCDPHEIANVCGKEGIEFIIEDSKKSNFHFAFTVPSCVPSTNFETSGFTLNSKEVEKLLQRKEMYALAEIMNYPGVLNKDEEVLKKIDVAHKIGKPIDGHAPCLSGEGLKTYASYGISTDHECSTIIEAEEKLRLGINIIIRQGSAAKNYEALCNLIDSYPEKIMFCSDDKHPDDLLKGHINELVKESIQRGYNLWNILLAASYNPIKHYNLPIGLIQKGDSADFILVNNLQDFDVLATYINGENVLNSIQDAKSSTKTINNFNAKEIDLIDLRVKPLSNIIKVIVAEDKELITKKTISETKIEDNNVVSNEENDVLKFIVCNRYNASKPAIAFIKGFNLKNCALASSIAHDSHNIIAIGTSDKLIQQAVNSLIAIKGGIIALDDREQKILPLEIAGLMSNEDAYIVAEKYKVVNEFAKRHNCAFASPFMTMAFMSLLVIPSLKLSDKGLFDVDKFSFTSLFE